MRRNKLIAILLSAAIALAVPSLFVYREVRQARLNQMLLDAILAEKFEDALMLARRGAEGKPLAGRDD